MTASFADKGTVSTARFRAPGLTVTPELNPPLLRFLDAGGLGMVGGPADSLIDAGESALFALDLAATGRIAGLTPPGTPTNMAWHRAARLSG